MTRPPSRPCDLATATAAATVQRPSYEFAVTHDATWGDLKVIFCSDFGDFFWSHRLDATTVRPVRPMSDRVATAI